MSSLTTLLSLTMIGVGILFALWNSGHFDRMKIFKHDVTLAICVLSAQNHFEHRKSIRNSWLSEISEIEKAGKQVMAKFVVGQESCPFHPENRLDPYDCKRWDPSIPENPLEVMLFKVTSLTMDTNGNTTPVIAQHLYVKVMSDIILKRLGLLEHLAVQRFQQNQTFRISLFDAVAEEEFAEAVFSSEVNLLEINGYEYRPTEEIFLPKGFEFVVEIESPEMYSLQEVFALSNHDGMKLDIHRDHHNLVFTQVIDSVGRVLSQLEPGTIIPAASLIFSLPDTLALQRHINTSDELDTSWHRETASTMMLLHEEMQIHDDIMLLEIQDVYRNLPVKVAMCHQWFNLHTVPKYVLKTDDDCYINLKKIVNTLQEFSADAMTWWGNFRQYWMVERHGKWREDSYSSSVYPQFACGSGSVLSSSVSTWLSSNIDRLRHFQGEDVSMGIWLAGLNVSQIQDDRWRCDMTCRDGLLSLPELTPDLVMWHWNNSQFCPGHCRPC